MSIRLNKLLASRGLGARRKCDTIIAEGRVRVNGRVVREPGTTVEEQSDRVEVDGRPLPGAQAHAYFVINKPVGVITTLDDPQGRRTIAELLPRGQRLFPVGRLDADSSGLLLLTNDGELAHRLMHPRYGVEKAYRVRLDREPGTRQLERLAHGVEFEPGVVSAPARVRRVDPGFDAIMIEIAIHEGRYRQVRRMCEALGLVVTGLHRVGYGPLRLGPLARGMWRELSEAEVARLRAASAKPRRRPPEAAAGSSRRRPAPRPAPPATRRPSRAGRDDEAGETWVPGGGHLGEPDDDAEWPARPGRARGDQAFLESGEAARGREPELPWHAPEYRRGTKAAAGRSRREGPRDRDRGTPRAGRGPEPGRRERPGERTQRSGRTGSSQRFERRPERGEGTRATGRSASGRGPARPARSSERGPARPARSSERGPSRSARSSERGPSRSARSSERGPSRSARSSGRGPARPARSSERGPSRSARSSERGPSRGFSPRRGRGDGPNRPAKGRRASGPAGRGPKRGPQRGGRRGRNS